MEIRVCVHARVTRLCYWNVSSQTCWTRKGSAGKNLPEDHFYAAQILDNRMQTAGVWKCEISA